MHVVQRQRLRALSWITTPPPENELGPPPPSSLRRRAGHGLRHITSSSSLELLAPYFIFHLTSIINGHRGYRLIDRNFVGDGRVDLALLFAFTGLGCEVLDAAERAL